MKVKITNCDDGMLWYYKKIGTVFKVEERKDGYYVLTEDGNRDPKRLLYKYHCEVIK